ncbi:hypothetical protein PUN28_015126 [Cardiocondyla obscurior]|uniref:Secreted protein n=1 Tax=Cardiocondyla obscurior TaxID=286306 RepID=A0AAW2EZP8_9HYME
MNAFFYIFLITALIAVTTIPLGTCKPNSATKDTVSSTVAITTEHRTENGVSSDIENNTTPSLIRRYFIRPPSRNVELCPEGQKSDGAGECRKVL